MRGRKLRGIIVAVAVAVVFPSCTSSRVAVFQSHSPGLARSWTNRPFMDNPDEFQFAVVGDRTGGCRPGVFRKAMHQLNLLRPEFVMSVGDLIEGNTDNPDVLKTEYDEMDAILNSLDMRFFRVAGNHDIGNGVMAGIYRERYGSPYYHFVYRNVLFLVVCTEDPPQANISDAQVKYVKAALGSNQNSRWTFVFMHQPLFVEQGGVLNAGWAKIEEVLKDRPHTVFAGHWHNYAKHKKHGQIYIRMATTGGRSDLGGIETGTFDHIAWVTMTDQGPRIANLMLDGIHEEDVRVAEVSAVR